MSQAQELIKQMPQAFNPDKVPGLNAVIEFRVSTTIHARIADGACEVHEGEAESPDVTVKIKDKDLIDLLCGRLGGVMAYMTGKLRVKGDTSLARRALSAFDMNRIN